MLFYTLLVMFGFLTGITAVLFGFGGGFVIVPLLYVMLNVVNGADSLIAQKAIHIGIATSTCVMIVNAIVSTNKHHKLGNVLWSYVFPLSVYIAIGSIVGVILTTMASNHLVRYAFMLYLIATIIDCLFRKGFMKRDETIQARKLNQMETIGGGFVIGTIATFLGVGGSIMTVPLLRRRGLSMTQATAMANPLSLPVAITGTITYVVLAFYKPIDLGTWYVGYIDILAFFILSISSILGVKFASRYIGKIAETIHAKVYVFLLCLVLLSMFYK
jgi:uncharacterized membrane protein YfcA